MDVEKLKWILDVLTMRPCNAQRVYIFKLYWGLSGGKPCKLLDLGERFGLSYEAIRQRCLVVETQLRHTPLWDQDP